MRKVRPRIISAAVNIFCNFSGFLQCLWWTQCVELSRRHRAQLLKKAHALRMPCSGVLCDRGAHRTPDTRDSQHLDPSFKYFIYQNPFFKSLPFNMEETVERVSMLAQVKWTRCQKNLLGRFFFLLVSSCPQQKYSFFPLVGYIPENYVCFSIGKNLFCPV